MVISFKELGDRIISWEKFMSTYPNSKLIDEIKENYNNYQLDYILGLDNTPTRERKNDNHEAYIYDENLQEFQRFLKIHPNSPTTELIKIILENFKDENIYDIINSRIQKQK